MGNQNSQAQQLHFNPKDWQEIEKSTLYEVMRNTRGQQANLYHFVIKSQRDLEDQLDIYFKRRNPGNWVQVYNANLSQSGFGFCGSQETALVLTERIPFILNSLNKLNKQDSLVVLYNALKGYNEISKIIVPGALNDKMIGFTKEGQTRVWINQNFGMNYPAHIVENPKLNESQVIVNLVNAISSKTQLNPDFVRTLKSSNSFNIALGFIRSNGGVAQNILQANKINLNSYTGQSQLPVLKDTTPLAHNQVIQSIPIGYIPSLPSFQTGQQGNYSQSWVPPTTSYNQAGGYQRNTFQYQTPGTANNFGYQPSSNFGYQPQRV